MSGNEAVDNKAEIDKIATDDNEFSTLTSDVTSKNNCGTAIASTVLDNKNSGKISDLKRQYLDEITDLRNQLDELKTKCMIIETTKQDELDELNFKSKQEIDSLNHIINALTNDLSSLRNEYETRTKNYKEMKKQHQIQHDVSNKSPVSSSAAANLDSISLTRNSPHNSSVASAQTTSYHNITQENENLEEDMRKAKESADMLRSVVLPLETEIMTLRSRSNTSEQKMKELEKIIDEQNKEKKMQMEEDQRILDECISRANENEVLLENEDDQKKFFDKYIRLKKYLYKNEQKFIDLEQTNLKAIRQVYMLLSPEQKLKLIPYRPKSKSLLSNKSISSTNRFEKHTDVATNKPNAEKDQTESQVIEFVEDSGDLNIKKNETINRIEELIAALVIDEENATNDSAKSMSDSSSSPSVNEMNYNYVELLAMYEKEKNAYADLESNFNQKAKESNKNIENLNKEMNNLATIIDDLRKQYLNMQSQFQYQLDSMIKLNEDLRSDLQRTELKNESYKSENLRLKAENKQFYGEQTILTKDFEDQYKPVQNLDESNRQLVNIRADMVKLVIANQALNRQHQLSLETIKHLQKTNLQYQRSNNASDQMVLFQSLESELERERKVRIEAESESREYKNQIKQIKDKSQTLIDSLRQRNDHIDFEQRKQKDENTELTNQIQSLKKDAKNSLSVQEDLVRLIQSLQIELNQMKMSSNSDSPNKFEIRCQHEDDFKECASCNVVFSVTKRKHRCQHCCKIFCADCCAKNVVCGPNQRNHKVCDSCHTLLDKTSLPSVISETANSK